MSTPLPEALTQETTDDQVIDNFSPAPSSLQPSIQCSNQQKLIPYARGFVTLFSYEGDISPDERGQRARIQSPAHVKWNGSIHPTSLPAPLGACAGLCRVNNALVALVQRDNAA